MGIKELAEIIPMVILIIFMTGKYILDYTEKGEKFFKGMREKKSERRKKDMIAAFQTDEFKSATKEAVAPTTLALMRREIRDIYDQYKDKKEIPEHVFKDYCEMFAHYKEAGGNSFTEEVIDPQIRSWKII